MLALQWALAAALGHHSQSWTQQQMDCSSLKAGPSQRGEVESFHMQWWTRRRPLVASAQTGTGTVQAECFPMGPKAHLNFAESCLLGKWH